ncbi:MAG: ribosomal protein [Parcubacteria group bacterium]|nr:ribosomal protein [Parcubacteria group bacterium]
MKVVLLKDVKNMGRAGSVHNVSDGHAMNLLIPRKLAVHATASALQRAEGVAANEGAEREVQAKLISERLSALAEGRVVITKKANEQGHLYDAVDAKDIAVVTQLPVDAIHLEKPLKEVGEFPVPVAYGADFGSVMIVIEAE